MQKGFLISFEGGEGSGKSTQIPIIAARLREKGQGVLTLREPGGSKIGEKIREIVLNPDSKEMAFTTEVMLFQAERAQLYNEVILPALRECKIILIDRTRDSSLVYQGMVRRFGADLIEQLNTISTQNTYPDLTFLLDVSVEFGLQRRAQDGDQNRIDKENLDFHQQVREAYLQVAKENKGGRWHIIDADQTSEKVTEQIWAVIAACQFHSS